MEDTKHFIAQNGLNGAVFLLFAAGWWFIVSPDEALGAAKWLLNLQNVSAVLSFLFAAIVTPIIGYSVQSIALIPYYLGKGPYNDESKRLIATVIRQRIMEHSAISQSTKEAVKKIANDSMFVAIYYQKAPQYLIEWARRRRDTQHLGDNWSTAAFLGTSFGATAMAICGLPGPTRSLALYGTGVVTLIVWIVGLRYMRNRMRDEADGMETVWALMLLHPEIGEFDLPTNGYRLTST